MDVVIRLENLSKSFGDACVLSHVSRDFEAGKIHGIVGNNGSGKTVMMKCICGFLQPTEGRVWVNYKQVGKEVDFPPVSYTHLEVDKRQFVLTLACGKYRFNDRDLGTIGGLPRLMDVGQCNDAYSAIRIALALADAFGCDVNELPLSMVLSWYEQKAVCILLTLLHLGIKNIRLGPVLPAFLSQNVLNYLVEQFRIAPISTPEEDLKDILG